jgi:8-oxo-dGTP pyrophosphatase MutT (NUDIX family)
MQESKTQEKDGAAAAPPSVWRRRIQLSLAHTSPQHEREQWRFPGLSLQESRGYQRFFPADPIPAAVLIPLVERPDELTVLLTQRASQLKNHAGQISFPGGRIEADDAGPREAALREAHEEIGLESRFVSVAGYLPDHILMSGFRVTPVVGFVSPDFELVLDAKEVQETFEVPLSHVFQPVNHRMRRRRLPFAKEEFELWDISYRDRNIWGATAGMLLNLYEICVAEPADE